MKSIIILIFSSAVLIGALPSKKGNYDWFFDKDFRDNTEHDNDPAREFFRKSTTGTTRRPHEVVTQQPDYDHTAEPDYDYTSITAEPDYTTQDAEQDYDTTDEYTREPDYNIEETSYAKGYYNTEAPTEPDYYSTGEPDTEPDYYSGKPVSPVTNPDYYTEKPVTETDYYIYNTAQTYEEDNDITTPPDDAEYDVMRHKAYYEKRKKEALSCKGNEHVTFNLDKLGKPHCQLCTCNGKGILLCSSTACSNNALGVEEHHQKLLHNAGNRISLILREDATDCKPGTTVHSHQCTCSCVLPSVMSCPKHCFYADVININGKRKQ